MMKTIHLFIALSCLVVLSACGDTDTSMTDSKKEGVFTSQANALKKAQNLEKEMDKVFQDQIEAIEEATNFDN